MSHLPNPFLGNPHYNGHSPPVTPGSGRDFLLMTRPPNYNHYNKRQNSHPMPSQSSQRPTFHELTPYRHQQRFSSRGSHRGRDNRNFTPRFNNFSPYNRPYNRNRNSYMESPLIKDTFQSRSTRHSGGANHGGAGGRTPLSEVPIEKFISPCMVEDPWAELEAESNFATSETNNASLISSSLENAEIIIDSDVTESSKEESRSVTVGEHSPVLDYSSHLFNLTTPSTSEKDTGSDSNSDAS